MVFERIPQKQNLNLRFKFNIILNLRLRPASEVKLREYIPRRESNIMLHLDDFRDEISVLSWNILAPIHVGAIHYTAPKERISACGNSQRKTLNINDWNARKEKIINKLQIESPDIICLQEVMLSTFEDDFQGLKGYEIYSHIPSKKRRSPMGNCTLFKKDRFHIDKVISSSCGLHIIFTHLDSNKKIWLSNIHLKAGLRSGLETRLFQIKSCLKRCNTSIDRKECDRAIFCGDFNDNFYSHDELNPLQKELMDAGFTFTPGPPSCYVSDKFLSFDHGIAKNMKVCYHSSPSLYHPIPNEEIPSDHHPIQFSLKV
jgi:endonuclease/exonuclease/phosphatase family metal-dependent hydrolase